MLALSISKVYKYSRFSFFYFFLVLSKMPVENTLPADSLYYQNPKFNADQPYTFQPSHYLVKSKVVNARGRGRQNLQNQLPPQHPVSSMAAGKEVAPPSEDVVMEEAVELVAEVIVDTAAIIGVDSIKAKKAMIKTVEAILARSPLSSMQNADIYSGAGGLVFWIHKYRELKY
jgi:hypothetical protein